MIIKFTKPIFLKIMVLLLCILIAIIPFFQPKKVYANPIALLSITAGVLAGFAAVGYTHYTSITPTQMNDLNERATANLKAAYPNATDYDNQVNMLYNLNKDLLDGKTIDPKKYEGKAIYAITKGIIDVLYPIPTIEELYPDYTFLGTYDHYALYVQLQNAYKPSWASYAYKKLPSFPTSGWIPFHDNSGAYVPAFYNNGRPANDKYAGYTVTIYDFIEKNNLGIVSTNNTGGLYFGFGFNNFQYYDGTGILAKFLGFQNPTANAVYGNIRENTKSKITLPTRLPQTIINNINNYNGTENLIIAPTEDDLKDIPLQDVIPDQPGTTEPEPTPEPTPQPTPPQYDGSEWINPIGNFLAGLLEFLKSAFIPTQTINTDPLTNANFDMANKFPFSLPNTLKTLFVVVNADGKTPVFDMTFDMTKLGFDAPIVWHIDLHEWDTGASVAKTSIYIIFLVGLILLTKKLFVK